MLRKNVEALSLKDTKRKIEALASLEKSIDAGEVEEAGFTPLFKGLVKCVQDNNFRVCLAALTCLRSLCQGFPDESRAHVHELVPGLVKRSGDNRQDVRTAVIDTMLVAMELAGHTKVFQKRVEPALRSPKWRVRESMAICFTEMVREFGPFDMNGLSSGLTDLLSDSQKDVRDAAMEAMRPLQKCLGKSLIDILTGGGVRPSLIKIVQERLEAASPSGGSSNGASRRTAGVSKLRDARLASGGRRPNNDASVSRSAPVEDHKSRPSAQPAPPSTASSASSSSSTSERALAREMDKIAAALGNLKDHDAWTQRRDALIRLRELLRQGAANSPTFCDAFVGLKSELTANCGDLRSAIVREACDTVSFGAVCLGQRIEPMLTELLDTLLNLTVNSKNIMADAGHDCIRTVIMATTRGFPRILSHFFAAAESRSAVLSTNALVYLAIALQQWNPHAFRNHMQPLVRCVRDALSNSCNETRQAARQAFFKLSNLFPEEADGILGETDAGVARQLEVTAEEDMYFESKFASVDVPDNGFVGNGLSATSGSTNSNSSDHGAPNPRPRKAAAAKSKKPRAPPKVFKDRWDSEEPSTASSAVTDHHGHGGAVRVTHDAPAQNTERVGWDDQDSTANASSHLQHNAHQRTVGGGARRNLPQRTAHADEEEDVPSDQHQQRVSRASRAQRVLPRSDAEAPSAGHGQRSAPTVGGRHGHGSASVFDVGAVVEAIRTAPWNVKAEQFRQLEAAAAAGQVDGHAASRVFRELAKAGNLDREHHRVLASILGFVVELFANLGDEGSDKSAGDVMRPFVDVLLPDFICLMAHSKEGVRNLAADALECFVGHFSFSELFPSIERVLGSANVRSQEVGLVVLMDCLSVAAADGGHSVHQATVTQILKRVLSLPKATLRSNPHTADVARDVVNKLFDDTATADMSRTAVHRLSDAQIDALKALVPGSNFFSAPSHHAQHAQSSTASHDNGNHHSEQKRPEEVNQTSQPQEQTRYDPAAMTLLQHLYAVHTNDVPTDTARSFVGNALNSLSEATRTPSATIEQRQQAEVALHLLRKVAGVKPQAFSGETVERAMAAGVAFLASPVPTVNVPSSELSNLVHRCLSEVVKAGFPDPVDALGFLLRSCFAVGNHNNSPLSEDQELYLFLFCVRNLFLQCRNSKERLHELTPSLLPRLVEGAHHRRSDVRKCSIVALAELSVALGSLVETSLAQVWEGRSLSDVHFQLIWHFSKRIGNTTDRDHSENQERGPVLPQQNLPHRQMIQQH